MKTFLRMALILSFSLGSFALDNPDAPDYVAEFLAKAQKFETQISEKTKNQDIQTVYKEYFVFLDQELNQAYSKLRGHLKGISNKNLVESQKKWLQFRDAEFEFLDGEYTQEKFGSSSILSRQGSRANLLKNRVVVLLTYVKNY